RVVLRRRAGGEDAEPGIPGLVQVRIARVAPDVGHLGARAHDRNVGADAHHPGSEVGHRVDGALDLAARRDVDGAPADLSAARELVGQTHAVIVPSPTERAAMPPGRAAGPPGSSRAPRAGRDRARGAAIAATG